MTQNGMLILLTNFLIIKMLTLKVFYCEEHFEASINDIKSQYSVFVTVSIIFHHLVLSVLSKLDARYVIKEDFFTRIPEYKQMV